jgi:hypothetical protein
MRYLAALFLGVITGIVLVAGAVYVNPFYTRNDISPLAVSQNEVITLNYSAVAGNSVLYTNNGNARIKPHPAKVLQLWEAPIKASTAMTTVMTDSRGEVAGLGIKFSSDSEATRLLDAKALADSVWHIYLPGKGSLFIEQTENYWAYVRNIVAPAYWSSADNWKGIWRGNMTSGPNALGTARVTGGSGEFANVATEAVEALTARAYAVSQGPVAIDGELAIEIPRATEQALEPARVLSAEE